jgi:hypothetical protein
MFIIKCWQRVIHVHTIQKHENGIITLGFNLVDCIVSLFRTQYWVNSHYHIRVELAVAWVFNAIFSNISDIIFAVHFIKWGNRYYADDLFNIKQSLNVYLTPLSLSLSLSLSQKLLSVEISPYWSWSLVNSLTAAELSLAIEFRCGLVIFLQ